MYVFKNNSNGSTITWVPEQKLQDRLAATPPEVVTGLKTAIEPPLKMLSGILTGALKDNQHTEEVLDDLCRGLTEVAQRALLRLGI